jgi:uncharacterized protein YndB with AHSA1/START domain
MPNKTTIVADPGSPLITMSRTFNAPRHLVYRCFTEPELLAKWLGPRNISTSTATGDNRHAGTWTFVQHDPDGNEYRFRGVFHGDPTLDGIVRTFEYEGAPGHVSLESVTFKDEPGGATTVTTRAVHLSVESRDAMIEGGMEHGVVEGNERLDELLEELAQESASAGGRS